MGGRAGEVLRPALTRVPWAEVDSVRSGSVTLTPELWIPRMLLL